MHSSRVDASPVSGRHSSRVSAQLRAAAAAAACISRRAAALEAAPAPATAGCRLADHGVSVAAAAPGGGGCGCAAWPSSSSKRCSAKRLWLCVIAAPWAARAAAAMAGSRDLAARGSDTGGTEGSVTGAARSHLKVRETESATSAQASESTIGCHWCPRGLGRSSRVRRATQIRGLATPGGQGGRELRRHQAGTFDRLPPQL
eukprot:scaffold75792_cov65-Phaeocystis_antarctica.AAC.12